MAASSRRATRGPARRLRVRVGDLFPEPAALEKTRRLEPQPAPAPVACALDGRQPGRGRRRRDLQRCFSLLGRLAPFLRGGLFFGFAFASPATSRSAARSSWSSHSGLDWLMPAISVSEPASKIEPVSVSSRNTTHAGFFVFRSATSRIFRFERRRRRAPGAEDRRTAALPNSKLPTIAFPRR